MHGSTTGRSPKMQRPPHIFRFHKHAPPGRFLTRDLASTRLMALLAPFDINRRRQGVEMAQKSHRSPYFFIRSVLPRCVFAELPGPAEHARVPHTTLDDPEQLIVRLARRMQCKRRGTGIKIVVSIAVGRSIRVTVAARTIVLEKL